jgi:hypothetical protein
MFVLVPRTFLAAQFANTRAGLEHQPQRINIAGSPADRQPGRRRADIGTIEARAVHCAMSISSATQASAQDVHISAHSMA